MIGELNSLLTQRGKRLLFLCESDNRIIMMHSTALRCIDARFYTFFYKQLDFHSEPGLIRDFAKNSLESW